MHRRLSDKYNPNQLACDSESRHSFAANSTKASAPAVIDVFSKYLPGPYCISMGDCYTELRELYEKEDAYVESL